MIHGISIALISAAAGYWVLTLASKEKGRDKTFGRFLGLLIVVLSLAGVGWKIYCVTNCPQGAMMGGKACPFTSWKGGMPQPVNQ